MKRFITRPQAGFEDDCYLVRQGLDWLASGDSSTVRCVVLNDLQSINQESRFGRFSALCHVVGFQETESFSRYQQFEFLGKEVFAVGPDWSAPVEALTKALFLYPDPRELDILEARAGFSEITIIPFAPTDVLEWRSRCRPDAHDW